MPARERCPAFALLVGHRDDGVPMWGSIDARPLAFRTEVVQCILWRGHPGYHRDETRWAWANDHPEGCEQDLAEREQMFEGATDRTRVRTDEAMCRTSHERATNVAPQAADTCSVGHDNEHRTERTPIMRYCTRCHTRQDDDAFRYVASQGRYHSWCRACERAARLNVAARARPAGRRARRRGRAFGVEIELTGPSRSIIVDALAQIGINVNVRGYAATNGDRWELKTDASVNGHGLELVSPKLYGDEGIATLETVLAAINAVGASVDRSCGIHVHIDFRNRTVQQIKDSVLPLIRTQDAIYAMCAPSRRSNRYSSPWSDLDIRSLENAASVSTIHYAGPRGFVNLGSYPRHGSIEFRSHGGSTNAKKITAWVRMLQAAVAYGEANPGAGSLGSTAEAVCSTLNLSHDDTQALTRFERAAEALEASEYLGV